MKAPKILAAIVLGLFAFVSAVGAVKIAVGAYPADSRFDALVTGVFAAACFLGGLALIRSAYPGLSLRRPSVRTLLNPFAQAAVIFAVTGLAIAIYPDGAFLPALAAMSVFTVGTAVVNALRVHWWRNTAASIVAWLLLFMAIAATAEGVKK